MIEFQVLEEEEFSWVFVESRRGIPEPVDLLAAEYPEVAGDKGVIVSTGKLPCWASDGLMSHLRNRSLFQARYDPSLKGAVVVQSFSKMFPVGQVLRAQLPCLACRKEGRETLLRAGAIYPYCQQFGHQNHAPERQTYQKKGRVRKPPSPQPKPDDPRAEDLDPGSDQA